MFQITPLFNQLPNAGFPAEMMGQTVALYQRDEFFRLAHEKARRCDHLFRHFSSRLPRLILISDNLRHIAPRHAGVETSYLEKGFFQEENSQRFADKCAQLADCVVIVNNNDAHKQGIASDYAHFYSACEHTLFIVWDWDNHHWLSLSSMLAAYSDLYVPTHHENHFLLSRYNANITDAVAAGVAQWTSNFLEAHRDEILRRSRSNAPLGKHIFYASFKYRNRVVATLQPRYPSVGFSTHQFHELTPEQKFIEWVSHKTHWIVPVLNDIPIRAFDALATGGIPLIPDSLRFTHWLADAHPDDVLCYSAADIVEPEAFIERACALFDQHGEAGVQRRFEYALEKHHGDARVGMMLDAAARLYGLLWKSAA